MEEERIFGQRRVHPAEVCTVSFLSFHKSGEGLDSMELFLIHIDRQHTCMSSRAKQRFVPPQAGVALALINSGSFFTLIFTISTMHNFIMLCQKPRSWQVCG